MKRVLSKFGSNLSKCANTTSPAVQPIAKGVYEVYRNFYVWLFTESPNKGRMITYAMSRYTWRS